MEFVFRHSERGSNADGGVASIHLCSGLHSDRRTRVFSLPCEGINTTPPTRHQPLVVLYYYSATRWTPRHDAGDPFQHNPDIKFTIRGKPKHTSTRALESLCGPLAVRVI